jgi:hypothetical protein
VVSAAPGSNSDGNRGPAVEFNWGFLPNLQLHVVAPAENATAIGMHSSFGFGDS